ncbi:hypothetical protein MLD38_004111 [Melastoma candidum]|uniref:Uncharacterized protein n=1 Tax=Melastoma candidum TaxID=119954 RepID=A0ACB9SD70_9MYRT|nr:hypothetical protein MLD38_004111 [Melastoma candidum]
MKRKSQSPKPITISSSPILSAATVFVLQQKEHPKFKRKGDDLFVEHTPFSDRGLMRLQILSKGIDDEGMPMYQKPFMKGKLYLHLTVEFPDTLSPEQIDALLKVLPPKPPSPLTDIELDECEETTLHDVNMEEEMRRKQKAAREAYDDDEDIHGGAQRVQCAKQAHLVLLETNRAVEPCKGLSIGFGPYIFRRVASDPTRFHLQSPNRTPAPLPSLFYVHLERKIQFRRTTFRFSFSWCFGGPFGRSGHMMRQRNQFPNSGTEGYGSNRMQLTQPMEYGSADYHGQFEAFTPPRDDTYLASKVEVPRWWDGGWSDPAHSAAGRSMYEGQGVDASRSYYQGQRQDSRMHLDRHGSSDNKPPRNNTDMDVEYDKSPFPPTFESLEQKFLDDIGKLAKELNDAEDAENTRHREKINAINARYQEQLMSLRTKHANRRDEFLRRESTARQQQYQKAMIDRGTNIRQGLSIQLKLKELVLEKRRVATGNL